MSRLTTFFKRQTVWIAIGSLATVVATIFVITKGTSDRAGIESRPAFICDSNGNPRSDIWCIGPNGQSQMPNAAGIVYLPTNWGNISIRTAVPRMTEIGSFVIPSPCPEPFKITLPATATNE